MAEILLPRSLEPLLPGHLIPHAWQRYRWAGADAGIMRMQDGTSLVQWMRVNGFMLALVQVSSQEAFHWDCGTTGVPAPILHYVLQGSELRFVQGGQWAVCPARQTLLGIYPSDTPCTIHFTGGAQQWLQIGLSPRFYELLSQNAGGFPPIPRQPDSQPGYTDPLAISKRATDLIRRVLLAGIAAHPDIVQWHGLILQLVSLYVKAIGQRDRHRLWSHAPQHQVSALHDYLQQFLDADHRVQVTPAHLAGLTGLNVHQFRLSFQAHYGMTVAAYIHRLRMEKAAQLLVSGLATPGDIFLQVGYEDFSSFSRAFKAYYGYPPSQHPRR